MPIIQYGLAKKQQEMLNYYSSTPAARKIRRIVGDELNKERASLIGVAGLR